MLICLISGMNASVPSGERMLKSLWILYLSTLMSPKTTEESERFLRHQLYLLPLILNALFKLHSLFLQQIRSTRETRLHSWAMAESLFNYSFFFFSFSKLYFCLCIGEHSPKLFGLWAVTWLYFEKEADAGGCEDFKKYSPSEPSKPSMRWW